MELQTFLSLAEAYAEIYENQKKGYDNNSPAHLSQDKELKDAGISYGPTKHSKKETYAEPKATTSDGKTYSVDGPKKGRDGLVRTGGGVYGKQHTGSWRTGGHRQNREFLRKLDKEVKEVQKGKSGPQSRKKRLEKRIEGGIKAKGKKSMGDLTGKGYKRNVQGKGNKAQRRIDSMNK